LNPGLVVSEKGSPDTKLSPPSSSAAMLSTVTHCWVRQIWVERRIQELRMLRDEMRKKKRAVGADCVCIA